MLYPQNGDRIVTIDSVTSLHLIYKFTARGSSSAPCSWGLRLCSEVQTTLWSTYKLYDLHAIFLFQIISFKKYFYVSLGSNFFAVFLWRRLSCGVPWATAQSVKSGHGWDVDKMCRDECYMHTNEQHRLDVGSIDDLTAAHWAVRTTEEQRL